MMDVSFLRADALEFGDDPTGWPVARQLAVAVELYKRDPKMLEDALADLSVSTYPPIIRRGLEQFGDDAYDGAKTLASIFVVYLREWPLNWIADQVQAELPIWRELAERESWIDEMERRSDARREGTL